MTTKDDNVHYYGIVDNNNDDNSNKDFNDLIFSTAEPYNHISSIIEEKKELTTTIRNDNDYDETTTCLSEGSISGSITNLCNATLGAGVLSLPYAISKSGIIIGLFLLILAAICTDLSIMLLAEAMYTSKCKSYEEMTFVYYGRGFTILVEGCILVFCLGTNTAYIIAVGDMLEQTLLSYLEDDDNDVILPSNILNRNTLMIGFWIFIMFPVSLCQRINSLRYASFLSTCVTYLLIVAIIYHSVKFMVLKENTDGSTETNNSNTGSNNGGLYDGLHYWPKSFGDVFLACPIIMFSFANQINVCQVFNELKVPTPNTMKVVSKYSVLVCFVAYSLTSVFGYINFQMDVDEDILSNYCLGHDPDWFIMVSTCAFVMLGITLSFPFNVLPCRITLDAILKRMCNDNASTNRSTNENENDHKSNIMAVAKSKSNDTISTTDDAMNILSESLLPLPQNTATTETQIDDSPLLPPLRNFILTLFISGLALIFALLIPNISILFGLMGGSASACICFIMPSLFYLKTHSFESEFSNRQELVKYVCVWCLLVGGFVIGVLGTAVTIWSLIYDDHDKDACS